MTFSRLRGLTLLTAGLVLTASASAVGLNGVLETYAHTVSVDSVIVTYDGGGRATFPTSGWGGGPATVDTFAFPNQPSWPAGLLILYRADGGLPMAQPIQFPMPEVWYQLLNNEGRVLFYGQSGVEEEPRFRPAPWLTVSASIVRAGAGVLVSGTGLVEIADAAGNTVRTLPVTGAAHWRGDDDAGRGLPAGVYFIRLVADGRAAVRKVLLAH